MSEHSSPPPTERELELIDRYWRAADYLSIGQIYLMDNPLLREPLRPEHIKPRLLGHWGTTPGLNFIYAHLNRVIKACDGDVLYVCRPGHGGPGMVANTYLEGTYSEVYPDISQDADGMRLAALDMQQAGDVFAFLTYIKEARGWQVHCSLVKVAAYAA